MEPKLTAWEQANIDLEALGYGSLSREGPFAMREYSTKQYHIAVNHGLISFDTLRELQDWIKREQQYHRDYPAK